MMPLTLADTGKRQTIKEIGGRADTKKFLENLGFVPGGNVTVVSHTAGALIVSVKDARVAINKDMALKIMV
ncbi:MAG: FeoA family protein [Eubacteriaceae bacterium]|nr:FeoA family protein [Eubacteriaceae bacterium]